MVDFPKRVGTPPADIWGYATRSLTDKADFTISGVKNTLDDLNDIAQSDILSDATPFPGGNVDAAISTRSSHAAAAIWAVATRELTGITGQPRTDLMGEDAGFEAGTGARKARIDDIPAFEAGVEGSLLMDGSEQNVIEKTDDIAALIEGIIDLTPMQSGDTVVVREYMQVLSTGGYIKYAEETYSDVQDPPACQVLTRTSVHDVKVSLQQTGGTYRTFDYSFRRRRAAS